jgi:hypothetical protein
LHDGQHLRVGVDRHRVVAPGNSGSRRFSRLSLARDGRQEIHRGDEIALLVRLDHHGLAVEADGEVVVMAGEQHVDELRAHDGLVARPVGVGDRDQEVGALAAETLGLGPQRLQFGQEP